MIREMSAGLLVGRERELQVIAGLLFGVRESGATLIIQEVAPGSASQRFWRLRDARPRTTACSC